jgi:16S rRNA (cytosine1402-N4)-methyltransferase
MHIPVLLNEVISYLNLKPGAVIIDATFGAGGHSQEISKIIGDKGALIGFEKDEKTFSDVRQKFKNYSNMFLINDGYENMDVYLKKLYISSIDGVLFDLGVSSMQFDEESRGFSFKNDGPLDMRFSKKKGMTAEDIVNTYTEKELSDIIFKYGEDSFARKIARSICAYRKNKKIVSTLELANIIKGTIPFKLQKKIHPATKTFQALRIEVNNELENVKIGLQKSLNFLKVGGRMLVISFHSLEDRIVKNFFMDESKTCICPKEIAQCVCKHKPKLKIITKSSVKSSEEEVNENPRSRSAKLRVAERI